MRYWVLALAAIVLDQWSKWAVLSSFQYQERVNVIPSFFDLTLVYNPGAAFSFLADQGGWQKYFFLLLAVAVSIYLVRAILRDEFAALGKTGAAMIIGGALGNVADRLIHGHVVDFLLFTGRIGFIRPLILQTALFASVRYWRCLTISSTAKTGKKTSEPPENGIREL